MFFNINTFSHYTGRQDILDIKVAIILRNNLPLISTCTFIKTLATCSSSQNKLPHLALTRNKWQHLSPYRNS